MAKSRASFRPQQVSISSSAQCTPPQCPCEHSSRSFIAFLRASRPRPAVRANNQAWQREPFICRQKKNFLPTPIHLRQTPAIEKGSSGGLWRAPGAPNAPPEHANIPRAGEFARPPQRSGMYGEMRTNLAIWRPSTRRNAQSVAVALFFFLVLCGFLPRSHFRILFFFFCAFSRFLFFYCLSSPTHIWTWR